MGPHPRSLWDYDYYGDTTSGGGGEKWEYFYEADIFFPPSHTWPELDSRKENVLLLVMILFSGQWSQEEFHRHTVPNILRAPPLPLWTYLQFCSCSLLEFRVVWSLTRAPSVTPSLVIFVSRSVIFLTSSHQTVTQPRHSQDTPSSIFVRERHLQTWTVSHFSFSQHFPILPPQPWLLVKYEDINLNLEVKD